MFARVKAAARQAKQQRPPSPTAASSDEEDTTNAGEGLPLPPSPYDPTDDVAFIPPALRANAWEEGNPTKFKVRSGTYLTTKTKGPAPLPVFRLITCDLVQTAKPLYSGLCSHPEERIQMALAQERDLGEKLLPAFIYAVNLCFPGSNKQTYHWVAYFGTDDVEALRDPSTPLGRLAEPFFFGDDDDFRNQTFKLIPRIVQGNVVVRKAVGSKPAVLGKKLKHYYIRQERFFEMVVDISSNNVAQRIVKCALGCAKNLTVDMMFLMEGKSEETLPEVILGGTRLVNLDFKLKDGQRTVRMV